MNRSSIDFTAGGIRGRKEAKESGFGGCNSCRIVVAGRS